MVKALVVGLGSIGRRHVDVLKEIGCQVASVSQHIEPAEDHIFADVDTAIARFRPDYVVIASVTSKHMSTLRKVKACGHAGPILVEKPLRSTSDHDLMLSDFDSTNVFVGYNLRFHPVLVELRRVIAAQKCVLADFYCGSFLPDWRTGTDYRRSSSALLKADGGVLNDLSHEIDYALWLLGDWKAAAGVNRRLGALEIETDDVAIMMMETVRCPAVTIRVNYLDRQPARQIRIITESQTLLGDLLTGEFHDGETAAARFEVARNATYASMHTAILAGTAENCCSFAEAEKVSMAITAIRKAARTRSWVSR